MENSDPTPVPDFASDAWLKHFLLKTLLSARDRIDNAHRAAEAADPARVDLDSYAHVLVPRRQRKVWKWLQELSSEHPWIDADDDTGVLRIMPSVEVGGVASKIAEHAEAEALVGALQEIGIAAELQLSYR